MSFPAVVDLDDIAAGTGGFKIQGESDGDYAGYSVSAAGDVNGDGIDDLIVGATDNGSGGTDAGAAYVVFGTPAASPTPVDLDDIAAGTGGFKIQGENADDHAGYSVSAAGDVNGDGIDDLIVGAIGNDSGGTMPAPPMWCSARPAGSRRRSISTTIAAGTGGFKIQGENAGDCAGISVSAAGDVNGDGIDDLIVGASSTTAAAACRRGLCRLRHTGGFADAGRPRRRSPPAPAASRSRARTPAIAPASRCRRRATSMATASTT